MRGARVDVEQAAAEDPFVAAGVGEYEIITVDPARMNDVLRDLPEASKSLRASGTELRCR